MPKSEIVKADNTDIAVTTIEDPMDVAIEIAMEAIRDSYYLTDEVSETDSVKFLLHVSERCQELAGEICGEMVKKSAMREVAR